MKVVAPVVFCCFCGYFKARWAARTSRILSSGIKLNVCMTRMHGIRTLSCCSPSISFSNSAWYSSYRSVYLFGEQDIPGGGERGATMRDCSEIGATVIQQEWGCNTLLLYDCVMLVYQVALQHIMQQFAHVSKRANPGYAPSSSDWSFSEKVICYAQDAYTIEIYTESIFERLTQASSLRH